MFTKTHDIHISGQLTLIRSPAGQCFEWLHINDLWHRRLTAAAFVWLRAQVNAAIESGKLSDSFSDAPERLLEIERIGISHGCFTAADINPFVEPQANFSWWAGVPRWAEEI